MGCLHNVLRLFWLFLKGYGHTVLLVQKSGASGKIFHTLFSYYILDAKADLYIGL